MIPTQEQSDILDFTNSTSDNLMINALAGTGKSAMLKMIDKSNKIKPALYLVFNKRNQTEALEAQTDGEFAPTTAIKTFNGLGHGIWKASIAKEITLDKRKTQNLWKLKLDDLSFAERQEVWKEYPIVMDGVEKAKSLGYVPKSIKYTHRSLIDRETLHHCMDEQPNEYAAELIDDLLSESIRRAYIGLIDFNDQIYMPALFGGTFPKYPRIMVDEYQDQSPVNHVLLERLVKGRIIGVGDPFQNIYGFRGAKADGMSYAVSHYSMSELPLSISFRCPSEIVKSVHWHVPHFRWNEIGGEVHVAQIYEGSNIPDDVTVICRNNAPLLRLAFKLISAGRSVNVVGSDLGPRIVTIMKKLGSPMINKTMTLNAIDKWETERLAAGSRSAEDIADCMRVFAHHGDRLTTMISYAEHIFKQNGTISLITGHKAKGLEYDNVIFLDPTPPRPQRTRPKSPLCHPNTKQK
jgi:superfamily I DNA/RNA helicase